MKLLKYRDERGFRFSYKSIYPAHTPLLDHSDDLGRLLFSRFCHFPLLFDLNGSFGEDQEVARPPVAFASPGA